jgi:hypothetical protein
MKKEQLVKLGLSDDVAKIISISMSNELKGYIPKVRFDQVNDYKKDLEKSLVIKEVKLAELSNQLENCREIEKVIYDTRNENHLLKEAIERILRENLIHSFLQWRLAGNKYADILITHFDKSKLSINEEGTVCGIEEQLNALQKMYKELF